MIRYNLVLLYTIYIVVVIILCIIDSSILLYYMFWILNIFIYPLFWLILKILFYNRTVLLLLLFYYILARYTIKIDGYKYFYFFGIDIKKANRTYLKDYRDFTIYHIELISIFIFFIVLIMPLFYFNKEFIMFSCFFLFSLIILQSVFKFRLEFLKKKPYSLKKMIFSWFSIFIILKLVCYSNFKDVFILYLHFDEWIFSFLELKIRMYNEISARDVLKTHYSIKPIWVIDKENVKNKYNEKIWNEFFSKKKIKIYKRFEIQVDKKKEQYKNHFKYIKKSIFDSYKKLKFLQKKKINISKKINYKKDIKYWDFTRTLRERSPKYNWFESLSHKNIISKKYFTFSLYNYYKFNKLLDHLTIKKEVYKQAFAHKYKKVTPFMLKKKGLFIHIKKAFTTKDIISFFDKILYKIKKNKINIKAKNNKDIVKNETFFFKKFYNYLTAKKDTGKYKFKEYTIIKALKRVNAKINLKENILKMDFYKKSKKKVLNNDRLINVKGNSLLIFPEYVEREKMEKIDNKLLLKTLEKYEKEKTVKNKKNKKREPSFILKKKEKKDFTHTK